VSEASHVFIAGLPRTGSTLTRAMLNRSPAVRMSGESRFLSEPTRLGLIQRPGYADRFRRIGDIGTDAGLERVIDHIYGLRGKGYWARLAGLVPRERFEAALAASDRSDRAFLDVAMALFADGRRLRGEKTPHHIHHVPTLLAWYPDARVIHTFRDPRAVYVSLRRKERPEKLTALGRAARRLGMPFDLYAMANLIHRWRWMARLHRDYAARYPDRYLLLRFEDLVSDPAATAERLAAFLGIGFDPAMLEQVVLNSSFAGGDRAAGIDAATVDRWRAHLGRRELGLFARFCGADLAEFGYGS
jgi:hypothetical protein